jgi:vacuolar-type H+-ATPase subunit E/Vma4
MGLATIVGVIEAEAEAEARRILAAAEDESSTLVAGAEASARQRTAGALARAGPGLEAEHARAVNAAQVRLIERRTELVAAETEAVFTAAEARLRAIASGVEPDRWRRALCRLAEEAAALAGPGATIEAPAAVRAAIVPVLEAAGARPVCPPDRAAPVGIRACSTDGRIEVDATLDARLGRARVRLAEAVAGALGSEA